MKKKNSDSTESLLKPGSWPLPSRKEGRLLRFARQLAGLARQLATAPIVLYQHTLSPDHGPSKALYPYGFCRFYPSCSEYTRLAILKYGVVVGYIMGFWRVLRCNPFSRGGIDKP